MNYERSRKDENQNVVIIEEEDSEDSIKSNEAHVGDYKKLLERVCQLEK